MKHTDLPRIAIISSLTGGLGHYCAHLASPLSKYVYPKFITYPQMDLSGITVKHITDSFIRKYIKYPRFDIDENSMQSIINIAEYLNSRSINIVNIHIATTVKRKMSYFTTLILYLKKAYGTKFLFTLHDVLPFDEDKRLMKLLKMFYSLADQFTVGNEGEKQKLMKHFNIPSDRIQVIPHGIYNLFDRNLYTKQFAQGYLGLPKDKKILLFFGWLREYKGFEYLIKAAKIMSKKNDNFIIYVASGLKYAPKELVENSLALIQKYNLQDKIMLNLNYLDTLDIEAIFKATDVVVLPYTHASQSGVMMMAFGFNKPVVITDAFYDREWVNEKAGVVSKSADPSDLAEKILSLMSNDDAMKKMGEYGYNYSLEHFNWEHISRQYAEIYKLLSA